MSKWLGEYKDILLQKYKLVAIATAFSALVVLNVTNNFDAVNYRAKGDFIAATDYINQHAPPGMTLMIGRFELSAFEAQKSLMQIRRDISLQFHGYELSVEKIRLMHGDQSLLAFFYDRDETRLTDLWYAKNYAAITQAFWVTPLENKPAASFRHIMADTANFDEYAALLTRNLYVLMPKALKDEPRTGSIHLEGGALDAGQIYFVSNFKFDKSNRWQEMPYQTLPANIFVPLGQSTSATIDLEVYLGNQQGKICAFETAGLIMSFNNKLIRQENIRIGNNRVAIPLDLKQRREVVNLLSMALTFNGVNQLSREVVSPENCLVAVKSYRLTSS